MTLWTSSSTTWVSQAYGNCRGRSSSPFWDYADRDLGSPSLLMFFVMTCPETTCLMQHCTSILPSMSSDSDVEDLPVDPVASSRDPPVFRACQVVLFVGHAHCYGILLVRIAWCLLGMISVHVQFLCRGLLQCRQGPRLSLSRWTSSYPLRARLPPLGCRWNCRRHSTCCFQVCLDPRRYEKEVGSVRADVSSCCYGLDKAQLLWRFVIQPSLCPVSSHIWTWKATTSSLPGLALSSFPPTV